MRGTGPTPADSSTSRTPAASAASRRRPTITARRRTGPTSGTRWTTACFGSVSPTRSMNCARARRSTSSSSTDPRRWTGSISRGSSSRRIACSATLPTRSTP
uniref:Uncharacterized protein n=1 Tax=Arundo donax TaxID=35708 RepID=A0A0A9HI08_ARUDO